MGQVYQATDTKLNRQVALKILPEAFATDPDRLARFQREAQVLASLNHPNIAQIHGIEEEEGTRALVLELVEGPTLADLISKGPIPLDEALPIAKQIAEALEAAHEAGVIHRDLKPANIKVREDGTVKVLDFGLAKALNPSPVGDPSESPTLTDSATQLGVIMGTAAYMAPEQAKGEVADKRADVWAFGVVLYEMLTGRRAFDGGNVTEVMAKVITLEPGWDELPQGLPPALVTYLRRCLQKDPRERLRDIGDVRLAMAGAFDLPAGTSVEPSQPAVVGPQLHVWQRPVPLVLAAIALFGLGRRLDRLSVRRVGPARGVRSALPRRGCRAVADLDGGRPLSGVGTRRCGVILLAGHTVDGLACPDRCELHAWDSRSSVWSELFLFLHRPQLRRGSRRPVSDDQPCQSVGRRYPIRADQRGPELV